MSHPPHVETAVDLTQFPLEERVRMRAHELYVLRGNESGSEMDDWLQAEDEIQAAEEENAKRK
jgi:hypothetical protein